MPASNWVKPAFLTSDHVSLVPLEPSHAPALAKAACTLATFRFFSRAPIDPARAADAVNWDEPVTEAAMRAFIDFLLGPAMTVPFCVMARQEDSTDSRAASPASSSLTAHETSVRDAPLTPVGITTYLDIKDAHRGLEIGWTWYAPACRGSASRFGPVNPACKLLLMRHAFESLGAIRVCLKTDERNARSRAAIERLGGRLEGLLRATMIMPDGHRRTTAMYSILDSEWPEARARLEARLARA